MMVQEEEEEEEEEDSSGYFLPILTKQSRLTPQTFNSQK